MCLLGSVPFLFYTDICSWSFHASTPFLFPNSQSVATVNSYICIPIFQILLFWFQCCSINMPIVSLEWVVHSVMLFSPYFDSNEILCVMFYYVRLLLKFHMQLFIQTNMSQGPNLNPGLTSVDIVMLGNNPILSSIMPSVCICIALQLKSPRWNCLILKVNNI